MADVPVRHDKRHCSFTSTERGPCSFTSTERDSSSCGGRDEIRAGDGTEMNGATVRVGDMFHYFILIQTLNERGLVNEWSYSSCGGRDRNERGYSSCGGRDGNERGYSSFGGCFALKTEPMILFLLVHKRGYSSVVCFPIGLFLGLYLK